MLPHVGAGFDDELLVFTVDKFAHALDQQAFGVALQNRIPLAAPQNFDDVPARTPKRRLKLLDNLTVPANWAVEALQVAVHNENQIVELLARGERDGTEGFRLIGFAVAEEGPDFGVGDLLDAAVFEVADEARLINGHQRTQAHRHRGKFSEVRHEQGMRIGREAAARFQFAAKIFQLLRGEPAFKEGTRIDAG